MFEDIFWVLMSSLNSFELLNVQTTHSSLIYGVKHEGFHKNPYWYFQIHNEEREMLYLFQISLHQLKAATTQMS